VSLQPDDFAAALPAEFSGYFSAKDIATPVSLPLADVLKNIPLTALRMREDQEEQERGANYATPFSTTAEEDAKRFKTPSAAVEKPAFRLTSNPVTPKGEVPTEGLAAKPEPQKTGPVAAKPASAATVPLRVVQAPKRSALQKELDTDEAVDPKNVVTLVEKIPGVQACAIVFGDGLSFAGKLPDVFEAEGLCAMAPSLMQRIANHLVETKLGALSSMTLTCTANSVTFFMHENLCLVILHASGDLPAPTRDRVSRIARELAAVYSQPA
jgi:predicted regulator of Ras-like GTPase activity (Roadblock/LC7/MglB family)